MAMHCIKREPSLAKYFDKDYDFVKVSDLLYSSVHTVLLRYISYVPNLPIHHCIDILATNVARVWSYRLEYQQNNFSLQFCPAYNLPIWLHASNIKSADINQKSADLTWYKLEYFNQVKTADYS